MGSGHPELAPLACDLYCQQGPTLRRDPTSVLPVIFKSQGVSQLGPGAILSWVRLSLRILLYQIFYNFHATENILQLIWRKGLSISDLLGQVEGKNRLRNGTFILQLVKDGDGSRAGFVGVVQAQDAIKTSVPKPVFCHA